MTKILVKERDGGRRMSRRRLVFTHKKRLGSMKKRSADPKPTPYSRTVGGAKRLRRNDPDIDQDVGDFIVVDTGFMDIEAAEDDDSPNPSLCSDATGVALEVDGTAVETKHQKSDIGPGATQIAKSALCILDSGEIQQTQVERPSISIPLSDSVTGNSSGHADTDLSPPLRSPLIDHRHPSKSDILPPNSHDLSTLDPPALKLFEPNPTVLLVIQETEPPNEPLDPPKEIDKHSQSLLAEGDHNSSNFSISETSISAQTSRPTLEDNLARHYADVRCLGTTKNDEGKAISGCLDSGQFKPHDQGSNSPGVLQTSPAPPRQTSIRQLIPEQNPHTSLLISNLSGPDFPGTKALHVRHLNSGCNAVKATASSLLASSISASNIGNIRVAPDQQPPAPAVTQKHYRIPSPPFPSDNNDTIISQVRSMPALSHPHHLSSPSQHNSTWMNVITGVLETSRTANDKNRLRERAAELIAGREDIELEEDETTGGQNRAYPDVCGAVVDKYGGKGVVAITAHGFPVRQVDTGQGGIGQPYVELTIRVGETCVIYGSSTVLYYKPRKIAVSDQASPPFQPTAATQPSLHELVELPSASSEITVRLQMDELGTFSPPYDFSVWRQKIKTTEFFAWFGSQTGRGGIRGPSLLTFTLKDAMPDRKSRTIAIFNEDDFRWMRKHILVQLEKAKSLMPGLKDFAVLVTDPEWVSLQRRR